MQIRPAAIRAHIRAIPCRAPAPPFACIRASTGIRCSRVRTHLGQLAVHAVEAAENAMAVVDGLQPLQQRACALHGAGAGGATGAERAAAVGAVGAADVTPWDGVPVSGRACRGRACDGDRGGCGEGVIGPLPHVDQAATDAREATCVCGVQAGACTTGVGAVSRTHARFSPLPLCVSHEQNHESARFL